MTIGTVQYTAKVHSTGGRTGASRSDDGRLDVSLSIPGIPGGGTNPEQLFAAAWSACFVAAMRLAGHAMDVTLPASLAVDAEVDLCTADGGQALLARFTIRMPGLERDVAQVIVDAAQRACPYSRATRGGIDVSILIA
jgi:Ohr subfamily peroxiredoxin